MAEFLPVAGEQVLFNDRLVNYLTRDPVLPLGNIGSGSRQEALAELVSSRQSELATDPLLSGVHPLEIEALGWIVIESVYAKKNLNDSAQLLADSFLKPIKQTSDFWRVLLRRGEHDTSLNTHKEIHRTRLAFRGLRLVRPQTQQELLTIQSEQRTRVAKNLKIIQFQLKRLDPDSRAAHELIGLQAEHTVSLACTREVRIDGELDPRTYFAFPSSTRHRNSYRNDALQSHWDTSLWRLHRRPGDESRLCLATPPDIKIRANHSRNLEGLSPAVTPIRLTVDLLETNDLEIVAEVSKAARKEALGQPYEGDPEILALLDAASLRARALVEPAA